jgi:hypothetical protein
MNAENLARVVVESPVHGPAAVDRIRTLERALRNMCPGCDAQTVFPCLACQLVPKEVV